MRIILVYAATFALVAVAVRFRHTWWAQELFRYYGVRPSGPFGLFTRWDYLRSSAAAAVTAIACLGLAMLGLLLADHQALNSTREVLGQIYGFTFVILAGMAALVAVLSLANAARVRAIPDLPFAVIAAGTLIGFSSLQDRDATGLRLGGLLVPSRNRAARSFFRSLRRSGTARFGQEEIAVVTRSLTIVPIQAGHLELTDRPTPTSARIDLILKEQIVNALDQARSSGA